MKRPALLISTVVMMCLFVSGMAGLVYEIVWTRYLALFLGHTSYAVVAVLVAFMGGLAIGNAWLGAKADTARAPLVFYGWLEIGIGVYGMLFPFYYALCHQSFVYVAQLWQPTGGAMFALKFAFGLLTVLLPTVLMGGTLPVLTKFVTRSLADLRARVAELYAINSAGAVAGCFLADFWLIERTGLRTTVLWAAAMNLAAGVAALGLNAWAPARGEPQAPETAGERYSRAELRLAVIGIGVSGFVAMLYEVAWTRVLALALGATTHAFALMLITFIAGLTTGAWCVARWKRLRRTLDAFAWAELGLAATLLVTMFGYEYLPYWFVKVANLLARREEAYPLYELLQTMICFGVMFIPTVFLGMTLPLVSRVATGELAQTGRSVGWVFAVNTLGTVLGAAVTGLWLLPAVGLARTFALGVAANGLIGLVILGRKRAAMQWAGAGGGLALAVLLMWLAPVWFARWPQALTLGLWRRTAAPTLQEFREDVLGLTTSRTMEYYRDGAGATVSVTSTPDEQWGVVLGLKVNGKADASTADDLPTQLMLGHLPLLLRPESQTVLVIGLGSGMTCGAVATHPNITRLDAVEILPEVTEAARLFAAHNGGVLDNPRLHLTVEDAKTFLQITPRDYDVIISEPSNPWMAGVASVFSREFYQSCRQRLRPAGVMAQWVQAYEISDEMLDIVLGTFAAVFPHVSVWLSPGCSDIVLIGAAEPLRVDLEALTARFNYPSVAADLQRIPFLSLPRLLSCEIISEENGRFVPPATVRLHSDLRPVLEYAAPRAFFARRETECWRAFDETLSARPTTLLGTYLRQHVAQPSDAATFSQSYIRTDFPRPELVNSLLGLWRQREPNNEQPDEYLEQLPGKFMATGLQARQLAATSAAPWCDAQVSLPQLQRYHNIFARNYLNERSAFYVPPTAELLQVLHRLIETDPANQWAYKLELAELAWDLGDDQTCLRLAHQAFNPAASGAGILERNPSGAAVVLAHVAEFYWRAGQVDKALGLCQLGAEAGCSSPVFELTHRKIQATKSITR